MSEPNRRAFVLTAAHCFHRKYLKQDLLVRLGDTIYSLNEGTEQDYGVDEILLNGYRPSGPRSRIIRNDIALLKLNRDPVLGPAIRTICLPHKGGRGEETDWSMEIPPETPVVSGGWGWEKDVGSDNIHPNLDKMKAINLYTLNTSVCEKVMAAGPSTVCAHDPINNADTCLGDSGGPLMRRRGSKRGKDDKGTWFVAGVLSYGPSGEENFCNVPGKFGVYTKLDESMLNWVYRRLGKEI
ncbi:serine protease 33-like [Sycon ciliatum]|uniref:serine protease 33-like n=1 Tax=Sycon ciliatum TaxID=27933 RepID=UPI0031F6C3C0